MQVHLSKQELLQKLKQYPGLIPVAIDVLSRQLVWQDMEGYHFYEGFFHKSLRMFSALKKGQIISFTTDLDVLKDDAVLDDYVEPTGFIFHAGRCGSSLLAKVLARSNENLVLSEAMPHNSIWQIFTDNGKLPLLTDAENKTIYRNLVLAMARRRLKSYKHFFIKFTSFNIRFWDFIHAVFPEVPCLFLSRNNADIVASSGKKLPGWLQTDNPEMLRLLTGSDVPDIQKITEGFLQAALTLPADALKILDYKMLNPGNLPLILSHFNLNYNESQLRLMKMQFKFDSKVEFNQKYFG